ncbi:MAG: helix-hairpin-helix domain-containing protein [Oscillospiraceae bacterium]|jgi:competence ComEA-like helix-hairpin-helix protein|nr:helix-hairpin-helix domain-containing protein [Oscillospiraceae bacterium]
MKLKKPELIAAAVTLLFLCFTFGYFLGRNSNIGVVTIPEITDAPGTPSPEPPTASAAPSASASPDAAPDTPPSPTPESHRNSDGLLQINLATAAELAELPGIGETLAARIVAYRDGHGDFTRTSSVKNVPGIGDGRYTAIKDLITVD